MPAADFLFRSRLDSALSGEIVAGWTGPATSSAACSPEWTILPVDAQRCDADKALDFRDCDPRRLRDGSAVEGAELDRAFRAEKPGAA
jgi:hypothetical protein